MSDDAVSLMTKPQLRRWAIEQLMEKDLVGFMGAKDDQREKAVEGLCRLAQQGFYAKEVVAANVPLVNSLKSFDQQLESIYDENGLVKRYGEEPDKIDPVDEPWLSYTRSRISVERRELVYKAWSTHETIDSIVHRFNRLPGPKMTKSQVNRLANGLGVLRPGRTPYKRSK